MKNLVSDHQNLIQNTTVYWQPVEHRCDYALARKPESPVACRFRSNELQLSKREVISAWTARPVARVGSQTRQKPENPKFLGIFNDEKDKNMRRQTRQLPRLPHAGYGPDCVVGGINSQEAAD